MGSSTSKASTFVESLIDIGMDVVNETISQSTARVTNINQFTISDGCRAFGDKLIMENFSGLNMSQLTSSQTMSQMAASITEKIIQRAKNTAQAAVGLAYAETNSVGRSCTKISVAVRNSTQAYLNSDTFQSNILTCDGKGALVGYKIVEMRNTVKTIQKAVTKSVDVTEAKMECVKDIESETETTAKGWDITWIILAIVVVIVIFIFGGFDVIAINVLKPSVWFLLSLGLAAWGIWDLIKGFSHNAILPNDTPQTVAKKEGWHAKDKRWGWIFTGVGGIAALITGFIFVRGTKKGA
jgi:hypothetical protein